MEDIHLISNFERLAGRPLIPNDAPFIHFQSVQILNLLKHGRNLATALIATFNEKKQQTSFVFSQGKALTKGGRLPFRQEKIHQ